MVNSLYILFLAVRGIYLIYFFNLLVRLFLLMFTKPFKHIYKSTVYFFFNSNAKRMASMCSLPYSTHSQNSQKTHLFGNRRNNLLGKLQRINYMIESYYINDVSFLCFCFGFSSLSIWENKREKCVHMPTIAAIHIYYYRIYPYDMGEADGNNKRYQFLVFVCFFFFWKRLWQLQITTELVFE